MEENYREYKIKWAPLSLYGQSFLQFIMRDYGYVMDEGNVLVADNDMQARRFVTEYCAKTCVNGIEITNIKRFNLRNYQCGFLHFRKGIKEEKMIEFLAKKDFFPVVVVGGVLPEYLRINRYIFRLRSEDIEEVCKKDFKTTITNFHSYVIENVGEVCKILEELDESEELLKYEGRESEKGVFSIFLVIGKIYCRYLQQNHSEQEAFRFFQNYIQESKRRLEQMEEFASGDEMAGLLSDLIWEYVKENLQIIVSDVEMIDERVYKALKKDEVILFNERYYFITPQLFMDICAPLLQTASEPEVKRSLKAAGILHCNSADYTVKKDISNMYGAKERVRMFWIFKEDLMFPDNLRLEDVFGDVNVENKDGELE